MKIFSINQKRGQPNRMEAQTMNMLSAYMPNIGHYRTQFSSLNSLLGKTTLTGKISSLDIAENLFNFMEETQQQFNALQDRLINTLIEQNFLNRYKEANVSVGIIANILVHSIADLPLDALALAKGSRIARFFNDGDLRDKEKIESLHEHFKKYVGFYTIYRNVLLIDKDGNIVLSLDDTTSQKTHNQYIMDAIRSGEALEVLTELDCCNSTKKLLLNIAPIKDRDELNTLGVLVTVFDFYEEVDSTCELFAYHLPNTVLLITDERGRVVYSDNEHRFPIGEAINVNQRDEFNFIEIGKKNAFASSWQADSLDGKSIASHWTFYRIVPLQVAFDTRRAHNNQNIKELIEHSSLRTDTLDSVILEAENIRENLGDVVINGEIIASKSRSYALNPILDSIRLLSDQINFLCIESIQDLQDSMFKSLYSVIDGYSRSAIQLLDHYFYEKSNDCRWIAQSSVFRKYLTAYMSSQFESSDTHKIINKLEEINKTYKAYADIVLFNANGAVLANSHLIKGTHHTVSSDAIMSLKNIMNSNRYYFSSFEVPQFSGVTEPSYTMMAPFYDDNNQFLGGIAFVINMKEIHEILESTLRNDYIALGEHNKMFAFFVDQERRVIASTRDDLTIDDVNIDGRFDFRNPKSQKEIAVFADGATYLLAIEPSVGYREFKVGSTHKNSLSCFVCVKIQDAPEQE